MIGLHVRILQNATDVLTFGETFIHSSVVVFPFTVIGRPPMATGIVPPKSANPSTQIGSGCVIGSNVTIYQGVTIGANVLIGDGVRIRENTVIGDDSVIGSNSTLQNDVVIGKRVRVVDLSHITAGTQIRDDVFWSTGVLSMNDNRDEKGLQIIEVGERAFIGGGAILLPGVAIGMDAIVAAGAVVTKSVEESVRVQGVPARRFFPQPTEENKYTDPSYDGYGLFRVEDDDGKP